MIYIHVFDYNIIYNFMVYCKNKKTINVIRCVFDADFLCFSHQLKDY